MDANGFGSGLTEIPLIDFIGESISRNGIAGGVDCDLTTPSIAEEPDEGADVRNLGHYLLVLEAARPGNHGCNEARRKCRNLHVKSISTAGVDKLLAVSGHS